MSTMIYPHRTDLKAWGKDNSSDFRMFDVGHLGNNKDLVSVWLERRKQAFFPIPALWNSITFVPKYRRKNVILVETRPHVTWHRSLFQSQQPLTARRSCISCYWCKALQLIMKSSFFLLLWGKGPNNGGRRVWMNYLLWCCHSSADTQVSLSYTVFSPILSASLWIPFKLQDVTQ